MARDSFETVGVPKWKAEHNKRRRANERSDSEETKDEKIEETRGKVLSSRVNTK